MIYFLIFTEVNDLCNCINISQQLFIQYWFCSMSGSVFEFYFDIISY